MKRLKLAIIRQRYTPYGGAERFVERAISNLFGKQVDVTIFASGWKTSDDDAVGSVGLLSRLSSSAKPHFRLIAIQSLGLRFARFIRFSTLRDFLFQRLLLKKIKLSDYAIVQSHERIPGMPVYRAGDGVHSSWLARRYAARLRWSGKLSAWVQKVLDKCNVYHLLTCYREKKLFHHPNLRLVICNSQMVKQEIIANFSLPEDRLTVIYNGVDTEAILPASFDERLQARTHLMASNALQDNHDRAAINRTCSDTAVLADNTQDKILLLVGSGFLRKGILTILQAMRLLHQQGVTGFQLWVVGADRAIKDYQRMAMQDQLPVRWFGPRSDVSLFWQAADALLLPSIYDPFPNAAMEGLAAGCPIFVSDGCGTAEILRAAPSSTTPAGWVHQAAVSSELASQLKTWLSLSPDQQLACSQAARTLALQFDQQRMAEQLIHCYQGLLLSA